MLSESKSNQTVTKTESIIKSSEEKTAVSCQPKSAFEELSTLATDHSQHKPLCKSEEKNITLSEKRGGRKRPRSRSEKSEVTPERKLRKSLKKEEEVVVKENVTTNTKLSVDKNEELKVKEAVRENLKVTPERILRGNIKNEDLKEKKDVITRELRVRSLKASPPEKTKTAKKDPATNKFLKPPSVSPKTKTTNILAPVNAPKGVKSSPASAAPSAAPSAASSTAPSAASSTAPSTAPSPAPAPVHRPGKTRVLVEPEHQEARKDLLQGLQITVGTDLIPLADPGPGGGPGPLPGRLHLLHPVHRLLPGHGPSHQLPGEPTLSSHPSLRTASGRPSNTCSSPAGQ